MGVSEGISVSQYVLSEEWELFENAVSEIRVKRIRVNQRLGVYVWTKVHTFELYLQFQCSIGDILAILICRSHHRHTE